MDPLPDPDHLRLPASAMTPARPSSRLPRHRSKEWFLKGPVPWAWLDRAGRLPGKGLAVGLALWQLAGLTGKRTVHICLANLDSLGLKEDSARRGIKALERTGLIEVQRRPGRGLEVILLEVRDGVVRRERVE